MKNYPDENSGKNLPQKSENENNQGATPALPALQLTPEQVNALIAQLYSLQQAGGGNKKPPSAPAPKPSDKGEGSPNNPGTRILFQSDDFDNAPSFSDDDEEDFGLFEKEGVPLSSSSEGKRTVYDDDSLFESEEFLKNSLLSSTASSSVKTTDFGSSFSVAEIELMSDDLSKIQPVQKRKTQTSQTKKGVLPSGADYSSAISTESENVETVNLPSRKKTSASPSSPSKKPSSDPSSKAILPKGKESSLSSVNIEEVEEIEVETKSEKKKLSVSEIIRRIVLSVSLLAIIICCGVLFREYKLHKENEDLEADISNLIISEAETTTEKVTKKGDKEKTTKKSDKEETTALTPQMQWAQIRNEFPGVIFPVNMQLKYARLYATNTDFVGYLSAEGVNLNLPIVQTSNDKDYLNKNFYGNPTKYGCPFVTHVNNISPLDMNTIIFGHHMNDGTVFGALDKYKTIDGFKKAPVITFNTLYNDYKWKVIAAFITNAEEKDDNGYVFKYYFASLSTEERFAAYFNELAKRSLYDTGVDVLPTDKILTLSTCSHEFENARFVVVARLIRPGESENVNIENAVVNSNPKYPQAYYDKKKLKNPFKNDERWEVG